GNFSYLGVGPSIKQHGMSLTINFKSKAVSGGDLAAFMRVQLPANNAGPVRPTDLPKVAACSFQNGQTATSCAQTLEAALKEQVKGGYGISRKGSTVTIQMFALR